MTKALHRLAPCVLASLSLLPARAFADTPAPARTPPPQIEHIVTTAFCARLHDRVRPAVAMILQNDRSIAKSKPLFKKYARGVLGAQDPASAQYSNGAPPPDSVYATSPETNMALQQMSYLVSPIAQNVLAAEKLLTDDEYLKPTGNPDGDKKLAQIKDQLLQTIAFQSASLDLINGWVTTQQMGQLQHAGEEYIASISNGTDLSKPLIQQSPGPLQDPNAPGLSQNPYNVDPAAIPGLSVGFNPLSRIVDGIGWLQTETTKRENTAATTITAALQGCNK
ncbi:MAG: hypothetical protein JO175_06400 [Candidatus Eremiobacteraeota bacterium]|nr:hypothetical protein [Candidatus Eremiobacteraeota bacterium]